MHFVSKDPIFQKLLKSFFLFFYQLCTFFLASTVFVFKLFRRNYIIVPAYVFYLLFLRILRIQITKSFCNISSSTTIISCSFPTFCRIYINVISNRYNITMLLIRNNKILNSSRS